MAIIDEKAARKMASEFLINTIGIWGILLIAKQKVLIKFLRTDVEKLRVGGYRISDELYYKILVKANET
jgi:Predicted nucleic acid-binding protein, contains PIN domain